jgi:hypothetical protein
VSVIPEFAKTNDDDHKIIILLDESGSMNTVRADILKSLNAFIEEQRTVPVNAAGGGAVFTLIKFNDRVNTVRLNVKFDTVRALSEADYVPTNGTALYDAIGATLDAYKNEKNVLVVIVTDGEENSSKKYDRETIAKRIDQLKDDKSADWSFVYIGCDSVTERQGASIGMRAGANCSHLTPAGGQVKMGACLGMVSQGLYSQRRDESMSYCGSAAPKRGYSSLNSTLNTQKDAVYGAGL